MKSNSRNDGEQERDQNEIGQRAAQGKREERGPDAQKAVTRRAVNAEAEGNAVKNRRPKR
jgi:hypothetical protein